MWKSIGCFWLFRVCTLYRPHVSICLVHRCRLSKYEGLLPPSQISTTSRALPQPITRRRRWAAGRRRPEPSMSEPVAPPPDVGGVAAADGEATATATDPELLCCLLQPSSADAGNADSDPSYVGVRRLLLHRKALAGAGSRKVVHGVVWIWFWVWWGIRFWIVVVVGLEV